MTQFPRPRGDLVLGHILEAAGIGDLSEVVVIRHTLGDEELRVSSDVTSANVLAYTRRQSAKAAKLPRLPPKLWLVFIADGGRRSRFFAAYVNRGEQKELGTDLHRYYDLVETETLSSMSNRLVIEWSGDAINWAKDGARAAPFLVKEIADPQVLAFPGFDNVLLPYAELQSLTDDRRYAPWRSALGAVQGIYLIADQRTGQLYVGKADGTERILGRWRAYARSGHGGNVALKALGLDDPSFSAHLVFSILRVFGTNVPTTEVNAAEAHFKRAMLTREHGLNRN